MNYKYIFWGILFVPLLVACSSSTSAVKKNLPACDSDVRSLARFCSSDSTFSHASADPKTSSRESSSTQQRNQNPLVGLLEFPVPSGRLSSPFGYRRNSFHHGVDITAAKGDPILACADGKVVFAGIMKAYRRYGQMVVIDHGGDVHTRYAHASRVLVKTGQKVRSGEKIALVGSSGSATCPHLHLEVEISRKLYNPLVCFSEDQLRGIRMASSFPQGPKNRSKIGRPFTDRLSFLRN